MANSLEELMRQREAPLGGNQGAGMAGFNLGGGNSPKAAMMQAQGQLTGARAGDAMAQARLRQQQEVSKQALMDSLRGQGKGDMASMVGAGINPNEYAEADANNQKAKILADAYTRATGKNPDRNTINLLLQVYSGKSEAQSKIEDGIAFNPTVSPDAQQGNIGQNMADMAAASIRDKQNAGTEKAAQANSAGAAAGEHSALADLARARTKEVGEKATAPKTGHALSRDQVLGGFGTPDKNSVMQVDPAKYQDFLFYQKKNAATDPRFLDANYALMNYKAGEASRSAGLADMAAADDQTQYNNTYHGGTNASAPSTPPEQQRGGKAPAVLFDNQPTPAEANAADSPDLTYDPQARGLPNTTTSTQVAKDSAAKRDAKIAAQRKITRTGMKDGKKVVQYDDGSIEYAQ